MILFIKKTILFLLILFILLNILLFLTASENDFIGGIKLKHRLLRNVDSPRIILIGGSGVGYSVDSELITSRTGKYTINMGLFAQFGLRYMLADVKEDVKDSDIVIISPEYHQFYYFLDGWRGFNELIYINPKFVLNITHANQVKNIVKFFPRFFLGKVKSIRGYLDQMFSNDEREVIYNEHGDHISHLNKERVFDINRLGLFHDFVSTSKQKFNPDSIRVLNEFYTEMTKKGANVFFLYPTIPQPQFQKYNKYIREVYEKLQFDLEMPVLSNPENEIQPIEDFYNTIYHLRADGREAKTKRLIQYLINEGIAG